MTQLTNLQTRIAAINAARSASAQAATKLTLEQALATQTDRSVRAQLRNAYKRGEYLKSNGRLYFLDRTGVENEVYKTC